MLLSMDLLQHLQVGCCWLPTHPCLAEVGVVNSRQLLQLGAGDRLLMVLHLQASLSLGNSSSRLPQALAMRAVRTGWRASCHRRAITAEVTIAGACSCPEA